LLKRILLNGYLAAVRMVVIMHMRMIMRMIVCMLTLVMVVVIVRMAVMRIGMIVLVRYISAIVRVAIMVGMGMRMPLIIMGMRMRMMVRMGMGFFARFQDFYRFIVVAAAAGSAHNIIGFKFLKSKKTTTKVSKSYE
jgi:hypothetical protein